MKDLADNILIGSNKLNFANTSTEEKDADAKNDVVFSWRKTN